MKRPSAAAERAPGFDSYAANYSELVSDGLRDRFSSRDSLVFHQRKRDVIVRHLEQGRFPIGSGSYLDVGCGKGELVELLAPYFAGAYGCDISSAMLPEAKTPRFVLQTDPARLPFEDSSFDFVTAVCVYHHVPPPGRPALTAELRRVTRPGGTLCLIEHNPLNPVTRLIVSRCPIDADARLLSSREVRRLMRQCGIDPVSTSYFLYLPERLYHSCPGLERSLRGLPFGGQYAVFGERPERS
jgi:SAM-dependent methyltransferase